MARYRHITSAGRPQMEAYMVDGVLPSEDDPRALFRMMGIADYLNMQGVLDPLSDLVVQALSADPARPPVWSSSSVFDYLATSAAAYVMNRITGTSSYITDKCCRVGVRLPADFITDFVRRMARSFFQGKCTASLTRTSRCTHAAVWGSLSNDWFANITSVSSSSELYGASTRIQRPRFY